MKKYFIATLLILLGVTTCVHAQEVQTRIGKLSFDGGYPSYATVDKLYDEMDFQRAVQAYLWAIPLVGFAQWQHEHEQVFGANDGDVVYYVSIETSLVCLPPMPQRPILSVFLIG